MRHFLTFLPSLAVIIFLASCSKGARNFDTDEEAAENPVVAHRGAWSEFSLPGNSFAALQKAMGLGCYASECDINLSSDGRVVVLHDGTWCGLVVKDHSYTELCNAGKLANGEDVPLLEDFINEVCSQKSNNPTRLWIDCKSLSDAEGGNAQSIAAAQAAATLIRLYHAENRVAFIVGRIAVWRKAQESANGDWPVAYMNCDLTPEAFLSQVSASDAPWANFKLSAFGMDNEKLKTWEDAGITMSFYDVDSPEQWAWWKPCSSRIKACTNSPKALMDYLK